MCGPAIPNISIKAAGLLFNIDQIESILLPNITNRTPIEPPLFKREQNFGNHLRDEQPQKWSVVQVQACALHCKSQLCTGVIG